MKAQGGPKKLFAQLYTWEGGEAVPNQPHKRRVKRDATGKTVVKIKDKQTGAVKDLMNVWIVWAEGHKVADHPINTKRWNDILAGDASRGPRAIIEGGYDFKFVIKPNSIIRNEDHERPALDGPNLNKGQAVDPPGTGTKHIVHGRDLKGGVNFKWDVSRRVRMKILNPNLYEKGKLDFVLGNLWNAQPAAEDVPVTFPQDSRIGNDDTSVGDEHNNPYVASINPNNIHAIGEITSTDLPSHLMRDSTGSNGDTFEIRYQFGEFSRLLIGNKWYRVSDYIDWRAHYKMKREAGAWVDDNSSIALDNNNF